MRQSWLRHFQDFIFFQWYEAILQVLPAMPGFLQVPRDTQAITEGPKYQSVAVVDIPSTFFFNGKNIKSFGKRGNGFLMDIADFFFKKRDFLLFFICITKREYYMLRTRLPLASDIIVLPFSLFNVYFFLLCLLFLLKREWSTFVTLEEGFDNLYIY